MKPLVHKHVIIRAEVLNPPSDENLVSQQIKTLIDRIGMRLDLLLQVLLKQAI